MDEDVLEGLNEQQREAVTHVEGPLLVLAGPGSGKTRVITRRVANLLHLGVHPGNILAITFTNKAAGEMKRRVERLIPGSRTWVCTFHSFGARILRQHAGALGLDKGFTIYDQADRARIMKMALENAGFDPGRFTPESAIGAISKAKNNLLSPERFAQQARDFYESQVARLYPVYEDLLRAANALDFDDLLYWPALALKNNPDLRAELDARFRFVLIDEYQDTNLAQYEIARRLSLDHPNLFAVGDADQSIYRFRGSDIRNILNFERDFPSARVIRLGVNYRSTPNILEAASRLIANNTQRKPIALRTDNPGGARVVEMLFESGQEEADGVARQIRAAVDSGKRAYRDFAILVRMNALTRGLELAFNKLNVPYQIVRGLAFYDRKEVRDLLAYLRVAANPHDAVSFERAISVPPRGVGEKTLQAVLDHARSHDSSLVAACLSAEQIPGLKPRQTKPLREFGELIVSLRELAEGPPDEVIRQALARSGYEGMLRSSGDEEDITRLENVQELITAAHQLYLNEGVDSLQMFLETVALASDLDGWAEDKDCVSVMTLHASKGLEFPVVFLAAMEQGVFPHERSLRKPEELEEERRLAFVGMTRAREELYLTHARMREFRGQTLYTVPSLFLGEIPPHLVESIDRSASGTARRAAETFRSGGAAAREAWEEIGLPPPKKPAPLPGDANLAVGARVRHEQYGDGVVTDMTGQGGTRTVKVRFPHYGVIAFRVQFARLQVVG
jgi:DNA helicase-2/ATP-dependent DNA helicase PcrA